MFYGDEFLASYAVIGRPNRPDIYTVLRESFRFTIEIMCEMVSCLLQITWYQAYFLMSCGFFQLFTTCALGTIVEIAVSLLLTSFK